MRGWLNKYANFKVVHDSSWPNTFYRWLTSRFIALSIHNNNAACWLVMPCGARDVSDHPKKEEVVQSEWNDFLITCRHHRRRQRARIFFLSLIRRVSLMQARKAQNMCSRRKKKMLIRWWRQVWLRHVNLLIFPIRVTAHIIFSEDFGWTIADEFGEFMQWTWALFAAIWCDLVIKKRDITEDDGEWAIVCLSHNPHKRSAR